MTESDNIYNCDDKDLGAMLQRLFDEGHDEVEVRNPSDGKPVIVTKADYKRHLANIARAQNRSPADRVVENKRLRNVKNQKQIRFRTAMITAPVHMVDLDDEQSFGKDIEGVELDIGGMVFLQLSDYPKGIELKENEVGCFLSEYDEKRQPIRITAKDSPGDGGANNVL